MRKIYLLTVGNVKMLMRFINDYNERGVAFSCAGPAIHAINKAYDGEKTLVQDIKDSGLGLRFNSNSYLEFTSNTSMTAVEEVIMKSLKSTGKISSEIPMVISSGTMDVISRHRSFEYEMTLKDFRGGEESEPQRYSITGTLDGQHIEDVGVDDNGERWYAVAASAKKFNFVDIQHDGKTITFTTDKDYTAGKSSSVQNGKISKLVNDLWYLSEIYVSPFDSPVYYIASDAFSYVQAEAGVDVQLERIAKPKGLDINVLDANLKKIKQRMNELLLSDLQPRQYKIKTTKKVAKIYGTPNADKKIGSLGNSCMAEHNLDNYNCAHNADFYNDIPNVRILYAIEKGKLLGRALIWDNATSKGVEGSFTFIDRIYGAEDFVSSVKKWGYENGYFSKVSQSHTNTTLENKDGKKIDDYQTEDFKMPKGKISRQVPYFDTMKHFVIKSKSKAYVKFCISSKPKRGSTSMRGTSAEAIILPCPNCGVLAGCSFISNAYNGDGYIMKKACGNCSIQYQGDKYLKTDEDIKLSFSSRGELIMPKMRKNSGKLVSVNINGKKVMFDLSDQQGIQTFFSRNTVKPKKKKKTKAQINAENMADEWVVNAVNAW